MERAGHHGASTLYPPMPLRKTLVENVGRWYIGMHRGANKGGMILVITAIMTASVFGGGVERVVILKVDGLPERVLERYTREARPRLPNISQIFGRDGTSLENFYVRGLSLSAPSWSMLDTGQHAEIRGNVQYDRYTLRAWDYLNFFPFYVGYAMSRRVDMPGVELLDQSGIPLLIDRFPYEQRYQGIQLLQRGIRWSTLQSGLHSKFTSRPIRELFDEWQTGLNMSSTIYEAGERDILREIQGTQVRYLDFFNGEYDHLAHLTADRTVQLHELERLDALVGRLWRAIAASPLAGSTALILVSDHGMNTSEDTISQGYNLVDWFSSSVGGGHHVLTNRHPMTEFKLKGLDPFVSEVITPSRDSAYLSGKSAAYPTVVMDLDGNERASIALRENGLNVVHVLLEQLSDRRTTGALRIAVVDALFAALDRHRAAWSRRAGEINANLIALRQRMDAQEDLVASQPKKWTRRQRDLGLDKAARREIEHLERWREDARRDSQYASILERLLALTPADFDPGKFKAEDLIPAKSLGGVNSIHDLQNYVVGPALGGLVLTADGSIDEEKSFRRINYFAALSAISVRNNVQKSVLPQPVESIAVSISREALIRAFPEEGARIEDGVWFWRSPERQAVILTRHNAMGRLELRYVPVAHLTQDAAGDLRFERPEWTAGFPLEIPEDTELNAPSKEWLSAWHDETAWFKTVHRTRYSNGLIGIVEALLESRADEGVFPDWRRGRLRSDLLVFANDHWNFNVRGFNPGGNHGSFLRTSTHSVLLVAGGKDTGIPKGLRIETPYDSLSFVPTILMLMGKSEPNLPGPVIQELIGPSVEPRPTGGGGAR